MKKSLILKKLGLSYDNEDVEINKVKMNSNEVEENDIFLAKKGNLYDGNDYINDVIAKKCKLIFSEKLSGKYIYKVKNINEVKDELVNLLYQEIIDKCIFIGVTGTNGKTTTTNIIYQVLSKIVNEHVILVGTNGIYYSNIKKDLDNTTPDELVIFNFIKEHITDNKKVYVIMEVSSHALSFNRLKHINFDIGVFLNLSHEHLDYYKNINNYADAKSKLFFKLKNEKIAIINIDDKYAFKMINLENKNIFFGKQSNNNKFSIIESNLNGLTFEYNNIIFKTPLIGNYNAYNLNAALHVLNNLNIDVERINKEFCLLKQIPGRMEVHSYYKKNIIIDFAHTPYAMKKVLTFLKENTNSKIITLFGCGGNRDKEKRPKMMEMASLYSDEVYLTSDNPRFEDPLDIIKDTLMGMKNDHVHLFVDRRIAIYNAIKNLNKDDYLVILGKGHEQEQIVLDKKIHFNDLEEVEKWIQK